MLRLARLNTPREAESVVRFALTKIQKSAFLLKGGKI